jgi:hypothetical protein
VEAAGEALDHAAGLLHRLGAIGDDDIAAKDFLAETGVVVAGDARPALIDRAHIDDETHHLLPLPPERRTSPYRERTRFTSRG